MTLGQHKCVFEGKVATKRENLGLVKPKLHSAFVEFDEKFVPESKQ